MFPKKQKTILSFFVTDFGRKVSTIGIGVTGIALFGINYIPQTFLIEKYKQIIQSYKSGLSQPVPEKVIYRIEKALNIINIDAHERKFIKPFTVFGLDLYQIGTAKSHYGAHIGIPINYGYESFGDINKGDLLVNNEPVKWRSPDGEMLANAIVLTEDEQVFGIGRAILQTTNHKVTLQAVYPTIVVFFMYSIGKFFNGKYDLYSRPFGLRGVLYSLIGSFGYGLWAFFKDYTETFYQIEADRILSDLGPEMTESGIRFYEKLLLKNIALRNITGEDTYTVKGNINHFIRSKSFPLTSSKALLEEKLKEYKKKAEQIETTAAAAATSNFTT